MAVRNANEVKGAIIPIDSEVTTDIVMNEMMIIIGLKLVLYLE
jgi:hypothetical protein